MQAIGRMMNLAKLTVIVTTVVLLNGCASYRAYERARDYEVRKDWDNAVEQYTRALEVDPGNMKYEAALRQAKLESSREHFEKGKSYKASGQYEMAALEFELTVKLDPTNQFALVELANTVEAARRAASNGELTIDEKKRRAKEAGKAAPPVLDPASDDPISLSFPKETAIKEIYRSLGNAFGINILFDQQVKDDKVIIELRDVTAQQALERVMQAGGHFYKVLDERTIIVVPDNPQARREYEDLVIQTFYLSNGDAEQVTNVVRTMIEARNVFPLKALNAITIRDTADKVRIAQEIIEANDKAKAEVVIAVELLQLDMTKARDIGMQINGLGLGSIGVLGTDGKPILATTLAAFKNLGTDDFSFTMPSVAYNFLKTNSESQVLAQPQLRISEGEVATLHIGRQVPLLQSTFTSANPNQGGTFAPVSQYSYKDVGIKISIEPRVHHNREVTLKLKVEVSDIVGNAPETNPPQPIISTRTIESVIRLKDGETNFLAGLIKEDEIRAVSTTPFLGDIPLIGRLFSNEIKDFTRTDLVLTMTPHIIRIANITEEDLAPMWVGTGTNLTFRGASPRIESQAPGDPFTAPSQFAPPPPAPDAPSAQDDPLVNIPGPAGPTDIFAPRTPIQQPTETVPPPPPPPSRSSASFSGGGSALLADQDAAAIATTAAMAAVPISLAPRISPQPGTIRMSPGEERAWSLVGMDLAGLTTPEVRMHYSPASFDVVQASIGPAFLTDVANPPVVMIDRGNGIIIIRSSDGGPLRFDGGGALVELLVRALGSGESFLVLDGLELAGAHGERIEPIVQGGRIAVQ